MSEIFVILNELFYIKAFEEINSQIECFFWLNNKTKIWIKNFSYMSLGVRNVEDEDIDKMMAEAPGALNFTTFLNMLAEKLHGTDPEDVMIEGNFKVKLESIMKRFVYFQIFSTFPILLNEYD